MTTRPILMSAAMVQATLREIENPGTGKTQTRRVLKVQPEEYMKLSVFSDQMIIFRNYHTGRRQDVKMPYAKGDQLYVRETYWHYGAWQKVEGVKTKTGKQKMCFVGQDDAILFDAPPDMAPRSGTGWHKRLGRFMPRKFSRISAPVTDVRVQRLQEIREMDAKAEGIEPVGSIFGMQQWRDYQETEGDLGDIGGCGKPTHSFRTLWDSLNGKPRANGIDISWGANPWVVAVSFKPRLQNVDEVMK